MKALGYLWRYLRTYKKLLVISLTMLLLNQILGLIAPLIVKEIIDEHLNGIAQPWFETEKFDRYTVKYKGKYYKQGKYFKDQEKKGNQVHTVDDEITICRYSSVEENMKSSMGS